MLAENELPLLADKLKPYIVPWLPKSSTSGIGGGGGSLSTHDIGGSYHSGTLRSDQAPQFALLDGSRVFTGNIVFSGSQTVDGVDLSVHAADANAHHAQATAGTLISLSGQQVSLANGSAQYQIPVTGATPFTPVYTALSSFAGNGLVFGSSFAVGVANTGAIGLSIEADAVRLTSSSAPGAAASILASNASGGLQLVTLTTTGVISGATNTNTAHTLGYATTGYVGFSGFAGFAANGFATTTGYALAQYNTDGTLYLNSPTTINIRNSNNQLAAFGSTGLVVESGKLVGSNGYVSGWAGSGWRADQNISVSGQSFAEFDNLSIRGTLSVYELVINQIRATNGTLIVSSAGKIDSVAGSNWTFEDPNASNLCAFAVNDLVIIQSVDVNASTLVKRIVRQVSAVSGKTITVTTAAGAPADTSSAVAGDTVVRIGNTSNAARQGVVLITSDMSNSPYQDVISGVASWADWTGGTKTRVRMGNLSGITGTANEYGLIAGNGFTTADSWVKFSTVAVTQNNVDSTWYSAGVPALKISSDYGIDIKLNESENSYITWRDSLGVGAAKASITVVNSTSSGMVLQSNIADATKESIAWIVATNTAAATSSCGLYLRNGLSGSYDSYAQMSSKRFAVGYSKYLYMTEAWSNLAVGNHSEISNDIGTFQALMIAGNKSFDSTNRRVNIYDQAYVSSIVEVGQERSTGNISKFTGRNTTISSISLTATTGFYGAAIGFNAHHANDSVSPTASGAFKFLGTQYTGNVTRPGLQFWDGNNGVMSWHYGEAGLASSADVTTWTKTFEISTTLVNSQLPITVSGGTELIKLNGSGTSGNASTGYIAFYDSNTTTRRGFIGDVSSANTDIYLRADTSALHLGDSTSSDVILLSSGGTKILGDVGFYNTTPIAKQTVTGSRGGNAALASLLTALASHGLITNSSTA